jgi:hypothetical protein
MTRSSAVPVREHGQILRPVPIDELMDFIRRVHERIARRAYEIYESRGRQATLWNTGFKLSRS